MKKIKRNFIPGGEWLFIKIYSGPKTLEQILINKLYPLLNQAIISNMIDSYFFIRYMDPEYHLRLRFHSPEPEKIMDLLLLLHPCLDKCQNQFMISNIVIDTYHREIERYGINNIVDVEQLFWQDSKLICAYLSEYQMEDKNRWLFSSLFIDTILNKCNLSLTDKIAFCKQSSRYYNMEFFGDTSLGDRQWGMKYRSKRYDLKQTLDKKSVEKKIITLFTEFESNAENFTNRLQQNTYEDNYKLLSSIIHMHVNRMFRTKQRLNECAIYNLLYRYYKSKKNMIHQN